MESSNDETLSRVGERIRSYRKSRGLRIKDLTANLLSKHGVQIGESMLSRIENGQIELRITNLKAIAAVLGVEVNELLRFPPVAHTPLSILDNSRILNRIHKLRKYLNDEVIQESLVQFIDVLLEVSSEKKSDRKYQR
ncbi:MAG: helix-turn-helix transcriptional regulator [Leptonema sp. (in: Bacteria)]|nr:helix-turn-helix transcriptional regulator [Leptonema sp. (in: bacteria)]